MPQAVEHFIKNGWDLQISESNINHPLLERLGTKYLLSDREIAGPHWEPIGRTRDVFLYRNRAAWPRAWIIQSNGEYDFNRTRFANYGPDGVVIEVESAGRAELVLADQYAPGWRAFSSDGHELRILKEQKLFRKVVVGQNEKTVRFSYQPAGFKIGLFTSLASLATLLCLAVVLLPGLRGRMLHPQKFNGVRWTSKRF